VATKDQLPPGDGWITVKDLAEANHGSISTMQRRISILLKDVKIEQFIGHKNGKRNFWYRELRHIQKNKR
jgi:hypothetical protein